MTQVPNFNFPGSPWGGAAALPAIRDMIHALRDDNDGPSSPPNPVPFMRWRDTSVTPSVLRVRNAANSAWVTFLTDIGATAIGDAVVRAANVTAAQTALGGTAVGRALFTAASGTAAQTALGGTAVGRAIFTAADAAAARGALEGTSIGQSLFAFTSSAADARSIIGAPAMPTAAAGAGNFRPEFVGDGTALVLQPGGTWKYVVIVFNTSGQYSTHVAGVAAGGTTIAGAFGIKAGWAWRVAG